MAELLCFRKFAKQKKWELWNYRKSANEATPKFWNHYVNLKVQKTSKETYTLKVQMKKMKVDQYHTTSTP